MTKILGPNVTARTLCVGVAVGPVIRLDAPLSLWGGIDVKTGSIVETRHPQVGVCLAGNVVVMPGTHGSSGGGSVLLECLAQKTSAAAWILTVPSDILLVGALVARELYGVKLPVVLTSPDAVAAIADGIRVRVNAIQVEAVISEIGFDSEESAN